MCSVIFGSVTYAFARLLTHASVSNGWLRTQLRDRIEMDLLRQTAEWVGATVFESESRSHYQVTSRSRYAGFPRMRCCCDPGCDVNCDAANLPSRQVNFTSMDAAMQRYTERRD